MKNISIIAAGLLLATGAMAQSSLPHGKNIIGKQPVSKLEKSRQMAKMLMTHGNTVNKSTATQQRMNAFSEYGQQQQGGPVVFLDSIALNYSGMRGSSFDYNTMSVGYFDPLTGAMIPDNKLLFFPDDFHVFAPNPAGSYTFTYDVDDKVTEMYMDENTADDERLLFTYSNAKLMMVENLVDAGGGLWDTAFKRYYSYDVNDMLIEDSLMENQGGNVWTITQKFWYTYNVNGNLTTLLVNNNYMNGTYEPYEEDHFTYNNNDQMMTAAYSYNDGTSMLPAYKDSFEYTSGFEFFTKDNYFSWDDVTDEWVTDGYMQRSLNVDMVPEMASSFSWDGTNYTQDMEEHYMYNVEGNPIHDSIFLFTNNTIDEDPVYVLHYYYEEYSETGVDNIAKASAISVYPNPVTDVMTIANSSNEAMNLQLVNAMGQTVKKARTTGTGKLSVGDLTAGMYWLTVTDVKGNKLHTQAIVKQ